MELDMDVSEPGLEIARLKEENSNLLSQLHNMRREISLRDRTIRAIEKNLAARMRMFRSLANECERHRLFLVHMMKNSVNFLILLDNAFNIAYCSESFLQKIGMEYLEEIEGKNIFEIYGNFLDEDLVNELKDEIKLAVTEYETSRIDVMVDLDGNGECRAYRVTHTPMFGDDLHGVIINWSDTTDIITAKNAAEEASKSKSLFLARVSHEIRTPMNAIIGMAELALREELPASVYEQILTIKQSGSNLLAIINDILDFSKIESGKVEIVRSDYIFASLINDVISIIRMKIVDSHVQFVVNVDCNIPNMLLGDETRIRQIMLNILSNAVKYTEIGYVSFTITGEITEENTVNLTMEVKDSGRGIKPEDMEKLFDYFVQVDLTQNRNIEGTGLGLAITRSLAKAMGGDISVNSVYGSGSTFTVTLPQKISVLEKLASVESPEQKSVLIYEPREVYADSIASTLSNLGVDCTIVSTDSELFEKMACGTYSFVFIASNRYEKVREMCSNFDADFTIVLLAKLGEFVADHNLRILPMPAYSLSVANILNGVFDNFDYGAGSEIVARFVAPDARVLVVDDVKTNLQVAKGLLLPYKMQLDLCKNGREAIKAVQSNRYDLVLMDHMMPGMDGIEATLWIRGLDVENPYYKKLPIVALTANAVSGAKEMFLESGFDDFLSKPVDTVKLNAILEKWIPREKQEKTSFKSYSVITVPEDSAGQSITIEGLDVSKGMAISGGIIENYKQTLAIFLRDGLEKTREIKVCLETNNLPLYVTYVHALKSASANIGAGELSEMAKDLEMAGNQEDLAFIKEKNAKLLSALELLLNNIRTFLEENEQEGRNDPADMASLKAGLLKLAAAIEDINPSAIKTAVNEVQPFKNAADVGGVVEDILQNTLIGEYDDAISTINDLLEDMQ